MSTQKRLGANNSQSLESAASMKKDERIGFRVPKQTKDKLAEIALKERRSLAQVCEILLLAGISSYEKHGSRHLQRFIAQIEEK